MVSREIPFFYQNFKRLIKNATALSIRMLGHLFMALCLCASPQKRSTVKLGDKELFGHPKIVP